MFKELVENISDIVDQMPQDKVFMSLLPGNA
jgi:hypothetical protein